MHSNKLFGGLFFLAVVVSGCSGETSDEASAQSGAALTDAKINLVTGQQATAAVLAELGGVGAHAGVYGRHQGRIPCTVTAQWVGARLSVSITNADPGLAQMTIASDQNMIPDLGANAGNGLIWVVENFADPGNNLILNTFQRPALLPAEYELQREAVNAHPLFAITSNHVLGANGAIDYAAIDRAAGLARLDITRVVESVPTADGYGHGKIDTFADVVVHDFDGGWLDCKLPR